MDKTTGTCIYKEFERERERERESKYIRKSYVALSGIGSCMDRFLNSIFKFSDGFREYPSTLIERIEWL